MTHTQNNIAASVSLAREICERGPLDFKGERDTMHRADGALRR